MQRLAESDYLQVYNWIKILESRKISQYVFKGRDSRDINQHSEANFIPFVLKFRLPKLRKWRIISQRDEFGRIIHSQPADPH